MDKQADLKRQLDAVDMELRQKLDCADKEARVAGAKIMAIKAGMTTTKAVTALNPDMANDDEGKKLKEELSLRLNEESERLRDIKILKNETIVGANLLKMELERELEQEKHNARFNIFMNNVGLSSSK